MVDTHGEDRYSSETLQKCVRDIFSLTPAGIIKELDLLRPIYRKTAAYGHFGRELEEFTWERLDKVDEIKSYLEAKN
jgi:S-adenosylmethionine synthetase